MEQSTQINWLPMDHRSDAVAFVRTGSEAETIVLANSAWSSEQAVVDKDWIEFSALAEAWKRETRHSSSLRKVFASEHYANIVTLGRDKAVPLIVRQLRMEGDTPYHWFAALRALTNENPVPRFHQGNMKAMSKYWIEWARRRYGTKLDPA